MAFNRNAPDPSELAPGVHLLRITDAREGPSKSSGKLQWTVTACSADDTSKEVRFWLPLEGKMCWKTSKALDVLGFAEDETVEAYSLIDKCFYGAIKHEEYKGEMQVRLDERAEGSNCGMWPEAEPPGDIANENAQASNLFGEAIPTPVDKSKLSPDHPDYDPFA